jgi:hypothetical protein
MGTMMDRVGGSKEEWRDGLGKESRSSDGGEEEAETVYKRMGPLVLGGAMTWK